MKMSTITLEEATAYLGHYPLIREALDKDGMRHVNELVANITDAAKRARILDGKLLPDEWSEPLPHKCLGDPDACKDFYMLRAAASVYAKARTARAA